MPLRNRCRRRLIDGVTHLGALSLFPVYELEEKLTPSKGIKSFVLCIYMYKAVE